MTRKEAIKRVQAMLTYMETLDADEEEQKDMEAYELAIKALKQETKTGHWTKPIMNETTGFFLPTCSECGHIQPYAHHTFKWNYCPSCGAKMGGKNE